MAGSTVDSLSTDGGVYLRDIAKDFGGAQAGLDGQEAAIRYLSQGEKGGVAPAQLLRLMVALSTTALILVGQFNKDPRTVSTTSTEGVGCTITVSKTNGGPEGAWGVADKIATKGDLGEVFDALMKQQQDAGGSLPNGYVLLVPSIACDNDLVEPISELQQEPAE